MNYDSPDAWWSWAESLDAVQAAAQYHKVLLENERARVLEACAAPGDIPTIHTHRWPGVLHVLGSSHFVRRDASDAIRLESRNGPPPPAKGSAAWSAPLAAHSLENVDDQVLRAVAVEIKGLV